VNINSISSEIGITLQSGNAAKSGDVGTSETSKAKISADKSSAANLTLSTATESAASRQNQPTGFNTDKTVAPLAVNGLGLGLKFSVDKETATQVIEVIDLKSGDVVRQIPPKEILNFLREVRGGKGVFVSRRL
jgi:uncharacterized FlaG/YvyC family protein